jgi:hypothetical protein
MRIKEGVIMQGLHISMRPVMIAVGEVWRSLGETACVTSALDGSHSDGSLHYYGFALDFRTRYFNDQQITRARNTLVNRLPQPYDVVTEGNHMHIEFDINKLIGADIKEWLDRMATEVIDA